MYACDFYLLNPTFNLMLIALYTTKEKTTLATVLIFK